MLLKCYRPTFFITNINMEKGVSRVTQGPVLLISSIKNTDLQGMQLAQHLWILQGGGKNAVNDVIYIQG